MDIYIYIYIYLASNGITEINGIDNIYGPNKKQEIFRDN